MQDGGKEVSQGSNRIVYPPKRKFGCCELCGALDGVFKLMGEEEEKCKTPCKLLRNTEVNAQIVV